MEFRKDGNNNPVYETAKETLMYRSVLWALWERERVGPDSARRVPAELGQESQASSCLRKGTPLADAGRDWGQEEKGTTEDEDGWMASLTRWTWV